MSQQSFAELGVSKPVLAALEQRGIIEPFPVQRLVIADVLAGHDVLTKSPTGSGKTLAFGIPMAERTDANGAKQTALILAPTRELASQIVEELREIAHARALSVAAVYGGAGIERQAKLARRAHIIVATPGRLEDLIARRDVRLDRVSMLVLDEADRMLDMGFRPAVDRIVRATPTSRQTLFFSATLDGEVGRLASGYTRAPRSHEHRPAVEQQRDIEHRFLAVAHEAKLDRLVAELRRDDARRTLVFVRTKRGADRVVKRLKARAVEAVVMHGNKSQAQREKALARFAAGSCQVLVATDVAARGIDVDGISHVINFDAPEDRDTYVHRTGRTGRAGRTGIGITFVMPAQAEDVSKIARDLSLHHEFAGSGLRGSRAGAGRGAVAGSTADRGAGPGGSAGGDPRTAGRHPGGRSGHPWPRNGGAGHSGRPRRRRQTRRTA